MSSEADRWGWVASPRPAGLRCRHVATTFAWTLLMLSGSRCFGYLVQKWFSWAGQPGQGRAACPLWHLDPPLHRHDPKWLDVAPGEGSGLDMSRFFIVAPDSPFVPRVSSLLIPTCEFQVDSCWIVLDSPSRSLCKFLCQNSTVDVPVARLGPSGLDIVCFGSILDMLFLRSNIHPNVWNLLDIMIMA